MKALVIGRHEPDFGNTDITVIERQAITFKKSSNLAEGQLWGAIRHLHDLGGDALLLQNAPGQVVAALTTMIRRQERGDVFLPLIGIIVSIPGERLPETTREFRLNAPDEYDYQAYRRMVQFANPKAEVVVGKHAVAVTVVPPMWFEFDHVEWLTGDVAQNCID